MDNRIVKSFLFIAGIIGLYVGGGLLFFPSQLQIDNGIILSSASHFSEARAPGAAILSAALLSFLSLFYIKIQRITLIIMSLFFISYGMGRLLSVILDGMPSDALFYAMIGELIMGSMAITLFIKNNPKFD